MPTFSLQSSIPVHVEELFAWHERPGAVERLVPPWEPVRVVERQGGVEDGSRAVLEVRVGPLRRSWVSVHEDYEPGRQFRDKQVEGPFAEWSHLHRFDPAGRDSSTLTDHIDYRLPFEAAANVVAGRFVRRKLEQMFAWRHERVRHDLERHAAFADRPRLRVAISGASGVIGSDLSAFLTTGGHEVLRLVRHAPSSASEIRWDPIRHELDLEGLEGTDAIVHLCGRRIDTRWTESAVAEIRESRIETTRFLSESLARMNEPPATLISASAVGFYGDRAEETLAEGSSPGAGFLAEVCQAWEASTDAAANAGVRVVKLRTGVVMTRQGPPLTRLLPPFRLGLGAMVGSGRQYFSWVALDDVVAAIHHLLQRDDIDGPVNVVSPNPVTNRELTKTLAAALGRPSFLRAPARAVRLLLGEMGVETALASQRVRPARLLESGYRFTHGRLASLLESELPGRSSQ